MPLLIVDDDREAAETLAELLRLLVPPPVEVLLAYDGMEALATATTSSPRPDAVILDIEMPRLDGVGAATRIRTALGSHTPLLIAVSGYTSVAKVAGVHRAFDHTLLKPVKVAEIIRLLRTPTEIASDRFTPFK